MTQPKPDWVMLGVPMPDGRVAIYASKDLNKAEIDIEEDYPELIESYDRMTTRPVVQIIHLTISMKYFVAVFANTYPEALAGLLAEWKPSAPEQKALPS